MQSRLRGEATRRFRHADERDGGDDLKILGGHQPATVTAGARACGFSNASSGTRSDAWNRDGAGFGINEEQDRL
jgi:hypothetical protein